MDTYLARLNATRELYPFARWEESGLEQYTPKVLASFVAVFDRLIGNLSALGEIAPEPMKLRMFQEAVEALNTLNEEDEALIETDEREDLCELCNHVAIAAGMDPTKYGHGEGPASEWRDW